MSVRATSAAVVGLSKNGLSTSPSTIDVTRTPVSDFCGPGASYSAMRGDGSASSQLDRGTNPTAPGPRRRLVTHMCPLGSFRARDLSRGSWSAQPRTIRSHQVSRQTRRSVSYEEATLATKPASQNATIDRRRCPAAVWPIAACWAKSVNVAVPLSRSRPAELLGQSASGLCNVERCGRATSPLASAKLHIAPRFGADASGLSVE